MLDIKYNAKHHPDWLDKGCDEDARQTWIDAQTDNLMCDADTIRDAIAELPDADLAYIGSNAVDAAVLSSPLSSEAYEHIGKRITAAIEDYAENIAERQWEMLNG